LSPAAALSSLTIPDRNRIEKMAPASDGRGAAITSLRPMGERKLKETFKVLVANGYRGYYAEAGCKT
jgi:hypothetical protein